MSKIEDRSDKADQPRGRDLPVFRGVGRLLVAARHDDEEIEFRFRYPTDRPSWYHTMKVYRGGAWVDADEASGQDGPLPSGLHEDRISIMIDDGSVAQFDRFGAYVVSRPGTRSLPDQIGEDAVKKSFIGERGLGSDVRKYIPESRTRMERAWEAGKSETALSQMRDEGVFLGTMQWRAFRSNPVGHADPGYVLEYRNSAEGRGAHASNWDEEKKQPKYQFKAANGRRALRLDELKRQAYGQDDVYALTPDAREPFDPERPWEDGDALPAHYLREPEGSRGAVMATGRYADGAWHVSMRRSRSAPNARDSKPFHLRRRYTLQFAVHTHAASARWHLTSMPIPFSLDLDTALTAPYARAHDWEKEPAFIELPVVYPGVVTLDDLHRDERLRVVLDAAVSRPFDPAAAQAWLNAVHEHEDALRA